MLVSLVGLPAVGKSTVGRRLAQRLGYAFADADARLEQRMQCSIRDYFELEGEARFRDAETALLEALVDEADTVIATGGGIVLRDRNRVLLRDRTHCVYLRADMEVLVRRVRNDRKRPLLQGVDPAERLAELHGQREPLYRESASAVVDTHGQSLAMLVEAVLDTLPPTPAAAGAVGPQ